MDKSKLSDQNNYQFELKIKPYSVFTAVWRYNVFIVNDFDSTLGEKAFIEIRRKVRHSLITQSQQTNILYYETSN